jgi:hypothetical protein
MTIWVLSSQDTGVTSARILKQLLTASKTRLGTAYGRDIEEQTHMTGNPQATWMCHTLTIKNDDVWSTLELGKDLQQGWGFTEG